MSLRALDGLKSYKYKPGGAHHSLRVCHPAAHPATFLCAGYTALDLWHTPYWDWFTAQLPMWLAPNTITMIGLVGVVASHVISVYYIPNFTGDDHALTWQCLDHNPPFRCCPADDEPHPWVLVLNAVAVCVYVNLDCIDGKQVGGLLR
jgi:hypothetical protein